MSGRSCLNFDDLAIACHEESKPAADMLKQGFLESFLASIGRIDLSMAAKEAAKFPDSSRGLDELLGKFPSSVLSEARLNLSSQEINLGVLSRTAKREIKITIENGGMRLLFGSITSDSTWLAIGETGNASVKNFQTTGELTVPLRIVPEKLRASDKPLVAKLKIDSSGGSSVVLIRAEVPVTPFQLMPLSGALNPRQIASKAKANAKEAAILFETGAYKQFSATVLVVAPLEIRIQRVQKRDGLSREAVLQRIENQWTDSKKMSLTPYMIINDGQPLVRQIEDFISQMKTDLNAVEINTPF
jgi:hypothetical protein